MPCQSKTRTLAFPMALRNSNHLPPAAVFKVSGRAQIYFYYVCIKLKASSQFSLFYLFAFLRFMPLCLFLRNHMCARRKIRTFDFHQLPLRSIRHQPNHSPQTGTFGNYLVQDPKYKVDTKELPNQVLEATGESQSMCVRSDVVLMKKNSPLVDKSWAHMGDYFLKEVQLLTVHDRIRVCPHGSSSQWLISC